MLAIKRALCVVIVVCLPTFSWSATSSCKFKRGDSNGDGTVQISDAQHLWAYAYTGGPAPPNLDAADANDDGYINGNDSGFITLYLFSGGSAPPDPGPTTADCDPTTTDIYETACTPSGSIIITSATAVPTNSVGSAFDCNWSHVQSNKKMINIYAENSEYTEDPCPQTPTPPTDELTGNPCCNRPHDACGHNDTETKWTFTWTVGFSPEVERLAFNTGCAKINVRFNWRAWFDTGGPCSQGGESDCPSDADLFIWAAQNAQIKFTFRNQATLAMHDELKTWFGAGMSTFGESIPEGGNPCNPLTMYQAKNTNAKDVQLSAVTWTGNDEWRLEKIQVNFLATWDGFGNDNSDEETIQHYLADWSIYLETLEFQNL